MDDYHARASGSHPHHNGSNSGISPSSSTLNPKDVLLSQPSTSPHSQPRKSTPNSAGPSVKPAAKPKQQQSCDACRVRKVRCEVQGENKDDPETIKLGKDRGTCKHCLALGLECTYDYVPRRRGPPNRYLKRMEEAKAQGLPWPEPDSHSQPHASTSASAMGNPSSGKAPKASGSRPQGVKHSSSSGSVGAVGSGRRGKGQEMGGSGRSVKAGSVIREEDDFDLRYNEGGRGGDMAGLGVRDYGYETGQGPDDYGLPLSHERGGMHTSYSQTLNDVAGGPSGLGYGGSGALGTMQPYQSGYNLTQTASAADELKLYTQHPNPSGALNTSTSSIDLDDPRQRSYFPLASTAETLATAHDFASMTSGGGHHGEESYMRTPVVSPVIGAGRELRGEGGYDDGGGDTRIDPRLTTSNELSVRQLDDYLRPGGRSSGRVGDLYEYKSRASPFAGGSYGSGTIQAATAGLLGLSPGTLDKSGMSYLNSPSEVENIDSQGGTVGTSGLNTAYSSDIASRSLRPDYNQQNTRGMSVMADAENPSTGGTNPGGMPIHELQSGTLGEIGHPYPIQIATYTSPASINQSSPGISGLLNPDPLSRSILPSFNSPRNPLDAIVPRHLLHLILGLFKDFVYPLTPCIHMPTLTQDLARRREMEPDQEEWTALVLATVMSTIVQVPRAFVPLSRSEVSALAEKCHIETRRWSMRGYPDNITVNAVVIRYFDAVYNYVRDRSFASCHTSLSEAQAIATVLRLHEEESYTFLNPIEREMRRRTYFLLFCADKSECVLLGRPVKMREEDCSSLRLPEELDDEYITETRYLQQPAGVTSIITGLNASIRIYCLIGRIVTRWREDKRNPPTGSRLQGRLDDITRMLDEVMSVMKGCPKELKLKGGMDSRVQSPIGGWDVEATAKLQQLFFDPKASREDARDAILVQAGNIYVNQQLARFVLLQYQNELLSLKAAAELPAKSRSSSGFFHTGGMSLGGVASGTRALDSRTGNVIVDHVAASKETLFYDLLTVLHSIPIQCIAVNGPSLVNTVRYIASALLDAVAVQPDDDKLGSGASDLSASVARAQGYLIDFLSILSEIEKHYSWGDIGPEV